MGSKAALPDVFGNQSSSYLGKATTPYLKALPKRGTVQQFPTRAKYLYLKGFILLLEYNPHVR